MTDRHSLHRPAMYRGRIFHTGQQAARCASRYFGAGAASAAAKPDVPRTFYVVLDTETTGLSRQKARIVEIAYTVMDERLRHVGAIGMDPVVAHRVCPPPGTFMSPQAERVHGISLADVAHCPPWSAVWAIILRNLVHCGVRTDQDRVVLVGHNLLVYDLPVITNELKAAGLSMPRYVCDVIDTLPAARRARELWSLPTCKLGDLAQRVDPGLNFQSHAAAGDVEATAVVFRALYREGFCSTASIF